MRAVRVVPCPTLEDHDRDSLAYRRDGGGDGDDGDHRDDRAYD